MPLEPISPSDNEINKADTSIPNSDELVYDIIKSLERKNLEDGNICKANITERNKIIRDLRAKCDHSFVWISISKRECRKCAMIVGPRTTQEI